MRPLVFAGNWKMNVGPLEAREYLRAFFSAGEMPHERSVWFFPPALSIETVAQGIAGHRNVLVGSQDIYWEPKGVAVAGDALRHCLDGQRGREEPDRAF